MTDLREQFELWYAEWRERTAAIRRFANSHQQKISMANAYEAGRSSLALEMAEKVKGLLEYSFHVGLIECEPEPKKLYGFYSKSDVEALLGGKNG